MSLYRSVVRPLLFRLSPDQSHAVGQFALRGSLPWRALAALEGLAIDDPRLRTRFAGVDLPSPVGLAAGLRQELRAHRRIVLSRLRLLDGRLDHARASRRQSVPAAGSLSADPVACRRHGRAEPGARLLCRAPQPRLRERRVPVFANIGGFSAETIAASFFAVEPHVDAVEISLMCPNLLRAGEHFDDIGLLRHILERIRGRGASRRSSGFRTIPPGHPTASPK